MADRYNVRNVAQKEVYDSYMGILRISPNLVYEVDEDDATDMLHTLADFRNEYNSKYQKDSDRQIKVQVSDSDGNMLPIYFIPRAFETEVTIRDKGNVTSNIENIINICTWADNFVYVTNNVDIRSTLSLKIKDVSDQGNKSLITIITGGQKNTIENVPQATGVLQYPIENPRDEFFFNHNNINNLFDPNDSRPRFEQMEENLYNKSLDEYKKIINEHKNRIKDIDSSQYPHGEDPHVKVGGKYVNTFNVYNEDVPVFYTRDYVLGHYEGHTVKGKEEIAKVKDDWMDSSTGANRVSFDENSVFTKLSWIRIDNLIWDLIDEIVTGKFRHNESGRYIDMGAQIDSGTQIIKELFGIGTDEEGSSYLGMGVGQNSINSTAPILGQGVQPGLIMYHAMPLHRYWFHRCRQIIYNMERYSKLREEKNLSVGWDTYDNMINEVNDLSTAKNNNLITGACRASITPHHSLVKDFLFCNGQTVNFENYPNISLTNTNLLVNEYQGKEAELSSNNKFENRTGSINTWTKGTYGAIQKSIGDGNYIKTPNLFSFNETYPRFIRALSWGVNEEYYKPEEEYNIGSYSLEEYGTDSSLTPDANVYWIHSDKFELENGELTKEAEKQIINDFDIWGGNGVNIQKPITNVSLYHYNYDFASKKQNHTHCLFSKYAGGQSNKAFGSHKWSELAAFYTYGTYGGVTFKVAPNESNSYTPHYYNGNEHGSGDYNYGGTYCLALTSNYHDTSGTNSKNWTEYCLEPKAYDTFHDFTPVGNIGLLLWNTELMNKDNSTYKGTTSTIESGDSDYYYTTHYSLDLSSVDVRKFVTEKIHLNGVEFPIKNMKTGDAVEIRKNRFKRKQQAIKLNEAEGRIPISYIGKAKYRLEEGHMIERKRSWGSSVFKGDKYDTEPITVYKNNIGNYTLKSIRTPDDEKDTTGWGWSCVTSLPYEFPEFLGFGDWKKIDNKSHTKSYNNEYKVSNPSKYYINHNVTDKWKKIQPEEKINIVKYGGVEVPSDTQSPAPAHMYLLPLIRL